MTYENQALRQNASNQEYILNEILHVIKNNKNVCQKSTKEL